MKKQRLLDLLSLGESLPLSFNQNLPFGSEFTFRPKTPPIDIYAYDPDRQDLRLKPCSGAFSVGLYIDETCVIRDEATNADLLRCRIRTELELEELLRFVQSADEVGRVPMETTDSPLAMIFDSVFMPIWKENRLFLVDLAHHTMFGELKGALDRLKGAFLHSPETLEEPTVDLLGEWSGAIAGADGASPIQQPRARDLVLTPDRLVFCVDRLVSGLTVEPQVCPKALVFRVGPWCPMLQARLILEKSEIQDLVRNCLSRPDGFFHLLASESHRGFRHYPARLFAAVRDVCRNWPRL